MPRIVEFAPAKVNLTLSVLGRRSGGYHEIESLVAFAEGVGDRVSFEPGGRAEVRLTGPFAAAVIGENLAMKALRLLRESEPRLTRGAVEIEKNLPVAAGLGGGSADAAAVLRAVRRVNPDFADAVDWLAVARQLGADVPVCLESRAAVMRGVGERVTPLPNQPPLFAVLVNACQPVPADKTARVFRGLDPGRGGRPTEAICGDRLIAFIQDGGNDLETAAAALMPEIAAVLAAIRATPGCWAARLSGAGPTCFGLYERHDAAKTAARQIQGIAPDWWVVASALK